MYPPNEAGPVDYEGRIAQVCTHLGERKGAFDFSIIPPVYETVNFYFKDLEEAQHYFNQGKSGRFYYTRVSNPTTAILEQKLAALEKAPACKCFASGMGAIGASILGLAKSGDHIVAVKTIYKNSSRILNEIARRYSIDVTFVGGHRVEDFAEAIRPNTTIFYLESPSSSRYSLQDLEAIGKLARSHGITTLIDNTIATPYNQNPRDYGIDVVIHSGSKYLNGHGDVLYGAVCADEHLVQKIAEREHYLLGNILGPLESWLALRGLRTFALRMAYYNKVGLEIACFLESHPKVARVYYPMLESHPQYKLALRQMRGAGSLMAIELKDGYEKVRSFINNLRLFKIAASWGSFESLVWYPATGMRNIDEDWLKEHELSLSMVRLSIGLEDPELIKEDLDSALRK
ncbi:aminotransferase class I/II-fold pyridoxal phosphate-dependent enzyme [Desulfofundulus sp. TPOSR]|uniref:trans-sulfuration enzyme family protein n=1 Tax=Desulfofundulus sp. TPOSR TaxID=2714340 RepID=UPI00140C7ABB|nr:aminotransferase class I/II-fold pyridoxal phosphate-dependent enzyme [Desulfofundulus sp. TPOSR]NHM28611.1 aminotransferase class I/II-fold pyridoxal phosphate-dependent enzyme [Desulfofundulus sp. TPOSR]